MSYLNQISELTEKSNNKSLTITYVKNWLNKNWGLYLNTVDNYRCSQFILPCMCCTRGNDCLFIDIYKTLSKHLEKNNDIEGKIQLLKIELAEYNSIANDLEKTKKWLKRNLEKGLDTDSEYYATPIKSFSFLNGRDPYVKFLNENDSNYARIKINFDNENDFEILYEFYNLFNMLFFEKKILPNEYEKFKSDINKYFE
ncbi:hypothetical protein [Flavobacterium laiguense]|uniref:Uncharacterized protein n=1 Tax=Flavobacterium laiguense TaxID=2169409 RepID=A0A2U1K3U7_9FLAO|nr:hypothetical protein [Flavobacterium laiguense]PWA11653.1 hypothetical protein DB891_02280 [Flavobacterium laiguense]